MIGYVMVGSNDIPRARAFWDPIVEMLGAKAMAGWSDEKRVFYAAAPNTPLFSVTTPADGNKATVGNGTMLAFPAASQDAVKAIYDKAIALGGKDEGAPGPRGAGGFYGAYFRDPDGNKVCIFKMG